MSPLQYVQELPYFEQHLKDSEDYDASSNAHSPEANQNISSWEVFPTDVARGQTYFVLSTRFNPRRTKEFEFVGEDPGEDDPICEVQSEREFLPYFESALLRFARYRTYEENWDSHGAARISERAIQNAKKIFLRIQEWLLKDDRIFQKPFSVAPLTSGGIHIIWYGANQELEVELYPDDGIAYLLVDTSGSKESYTEVDDCDYRDVLNEIKAILSS